MLEESLESDDVRSPSECALGFFLSPKKAKNYYDTARKLQETQGEYRGGGGRGMVMPGMTREKALEILKSAGTRPRALREVNGNGSVDLSDVRALEVLQIHTHGRKVSDIVEALKKTGAKPLHVEAIGTNPGALSFRTYKDTYGDIDPGDVPNTYIRVMVDNPTGKRSSQLQQNFHKMIPGPVVMSWSRIHDDNPGHMCYRMAGQSREFDELFRPDLQEFFAKWFALHDRYPTQQSKPGVEDSQPRSVGEVLSMHNGDLVNAHVIKQRLRDPKTHKYERLFFETYGKKGAKGEKIFFEHIAGVDSSVVAKLHVYLLDCCQRYGIDPLVISLLERPPSLNQIYALPEEERKFYALARLAFPEFSYQGSAATMVVTNDYARITPDRTRVLWIGKDRSGNVYVASNGGAITNACHPDQLEKVFPVPSSEILDIDLKTGKIRNAGMEICIPGHNGKKSIFMQGIGFDITRLAEVQAIQKDATRRPFENRERQKMPKKISNQFGVYGFEQSDIERLLRYGDLGTYLPIGLGNSEPDGLLRRAVELSRLTSEHKAFIVSPGRDNRIEFNSRMLLRNGLNEPILLRSPFLVWSDVLAQSEEGRDILERIAKKYGTRTIEDLGERSITIKATYSANEKLETGIQRLINEAEQYAQDGIQNLILDDTCSEENEFPIPASVACGAVHNALSKEGGEENLRSCVNIIGKFNGIPHIEEARECIMHGADAICPVLAFDAALNVFGRDLDGQLTGKEKEFLQRGINTLLGMEEDFAISAGSSGFHDPAAMRGNAAGMEYELGIADDLNALLGNIPGMRAGGIDLASMDLFIRSRREEFDHSPMVPYEKLAKYKGGWERWHKKIKDIIDEMTKQGASYQFDPKVYEGIPEVTLEDFVQMKGLAEFRDFPDEELRAIDFRVLDFVALMVAHMSIGANNIETWIAILAALYEIRHEAENIGFLNDKEKLVIGGIGEGGMAAELRMFFMHICNQYASGRFGQETNEGDLFNRDHFLREGLERMLDIRRGLDAKGLEALREEFGKGELNEIELLVARLVKTEYIEKDIEALNTGELEKLCRYSVLLSDKNGQDAKRGFGGMMMKAIMLIARIRGTMPHDALKSFFNHADGDSIEELRERIYSLMREAAGEIPEIGDPEVGLWSKDALDPYAIANMFGQVKAGAAMIDHDWRGGTGNRPIGTKRASHPWLVEATRYDALDRNALGMMTMNWMSSNRTPVDAMRNILLGNVDGILIATSLLGAMKCLLTPCSNCNTGFCPPRLTDQRMERRQSLYEFPDDDLEELPDTSDVDARLQKERAKNFLLAFIRTMKVLMKNLGASNIAEAKGKRDQLEICSNVEVEGADWIRQVAGHPYTQEEVERACSVSQRFHAAQFIESEPFPEAKIVEILGNYLSFSDEGLPNGHISKNTFLLIGDIANLFPRLSASTQEKFLGILQEAQEKLRKTYHAYCEGRGVSVDSYERDALIERHQSLSYLQNREEQEYLERLIAADRIAELVEKLKEDGNEFAYKDEFFARIQHSQNETMSLKSPRAIVSQENAFTIDRYHGVQRKIAAHIFEHITTKKSKEPIEIEIDDVLTDRDMGILSCLGALYHHRPEEFAATVDSITIHLKNGITGHNLGALVNGNYLFGPGLGKEKVKIIVGTPEKPAHVDGGVGMSVNGATIIVHGYAGDCAGAYASDLELAVRGAAVKCGMGAKGNTTIYSHEPLPDVTGICMTGNVTIICGGVRRQGEENRPIAKRGITADEQGLAKIILLATKEEVLHLQIPGIGTITKNLSPLDIREAQRTCETYYPLFENGNHPPNINPSTHCKVVSEHYYRNLLTSLAVYDFIRLRDDVTLNEQIDSACYELLELVGVDPYDEENVAFLHETKYRLSLAREQYLRENKELIKKDPDAAFLEARRWSLEFLKHFKAHPPEQRTVPQWIRDNLAGVESRPTEVY